MNTIQSKGSGFALLEVLISVLVFAIGLLGMAALQTIAIKNNNSAYMRSQASILASDIMDRMRANVLVARAGGYNRTMGAAHPTGTTQQDTDHVNWLTTLASALPSGDGAISCAAASCSIAVSWDDGLGLRGNLLNAQVDFDGDGTNDNDADGDGTTDREIIVLVTRL